jgi:uncharacterized membrane protein
VKRRIIEMQIRTFPDKQYVCDGKSQRGVSESAAWRDRTFWRCFKVMVGSFFVIVLGGILGLELLCWVAAALFAAAFIVLFALALFEPRAICQRCHARMKRRWVRGLGQGEDLFLVCDGCKVYVDAHCSRE